MFQENTVFVIGAGASAEFGFPVGWQLMNTIKKNSFFEFTSYQAPKGDADLLTALKKRYRDEIERKHRLLACAEIHRAIDSAKSIDAFIYRNAHDPMITEMGKVQIAFALAKAERESKLFIRQGQMLDSIDWDSIDKTWIAQFAYGLFDGVKSTEVDSIGNNITVISFNYDRSIEFYLASAIERSFQNVDLERAHEIVGRMNIIHPYGILGKLPVSAHGSGEDYVKYGPTTHDVDLWTMASTLITFSESMNDNEIVGKIKHAIGSARTIVFMGFAFAKQNMDLLRSEENNNPYVYKRVFSTGLNIPTQVNATLKRNIVSTYSSKPSGQNEQNYVVIEHGMACNDFMTTHLRNIME